MRTRFTREANAFRSSCERVSHAERTRFSRLLRREGLARERVLVLVRTRFTREANAFRSSCERVSHAERTRFGPCANAFHTQSERVSLGTYTRLRVKRVIPYI